MKCFGGTRVIILVSPRGGVAYAQNRIDVSMYQAVDLATKTAALMPRNITSMILLIERAIARSRSTPEETQHRTTETMSEYLGAMMQYKNQRCDSPH
uniref:Transcriptional regulator n=1 Tax=Haemonchus contortus TaxID=6289 RepID=A0A7I4YBC5_HAECO